jgi:hypothetical protein
MLPIRRNEHPSLLQKRSGRIWIAGCNARKQAFACCDYGCSHVFCRLWPRLLLQLQQHLHAAAALVFRHARSLPLRAVAAGKGAPAELNERTQAPWCIPVLPAAGCLLSRYHQ